MIIIPEVEIKETLSKVMELINKDVEQKESVGSVSDAADVNAGVTVNVTQQGAVGTPEVTDVTLQGDTNGSLNGTEWNLSTPSKNYYVWYDVDNAGNNPHEFGYERLGVRVPIDSGDSASDVAEKTKTYLEYTGRFNVSRSGATITITNIETNAEEASLLYQIFERNSFGAMQYYIHMRDMLKRTFGNESRAIEITLGWSQNKEGFPTVSILLPNEENAHPKTSVSDGHHNYYDGKFSEGKSQFYDSTYNIMITSDNQNEVIILYHFIKSILLMAIDQLEGRGLTKIGISGRDIMHDFELSPMPLYHRNIGLSFTYENRIPDIKISDLAKSVNFNGTKKSG